MILVNICGFIFHIFRYCFLNKESLSAFTFHLLFIVISVLFNLLGDNHSQTENARVKFITYLSRIKILEFCLSRIVEV
jgi:hypothetical protein